MAKKLWEGAMPPYSFPQPFGDRNKRNSNNKHDVTVLPRSASRIYGEEMEEEQKMGWKWERQERRRILKKKWREEGLKGREEKSEKKADAHHGDF